MFKNNFSIDARTSDAIAIAIRFNAPIYTYKSILDAANNLIDSDKNTDESDGDDLKKKNIKEIKPTKKKLQEILNHAIHKEDYELAAKIRDQIKKLYD